MFEAVIEQNRVKGLLGSSILKEQVSHAYLFTGMQGIGKTFMAKEFAKALLCCEKEGARPCGHCRSCEKIAHGNHPDFLLIEPKKGEATIKIDQIRKLIAALPVKPYESEKRITVIKDGDRMTTEAQNALLKSLEEPEPHNIFVITTENPQKIVNTIRSRCQNIVFEPLSNEGIRLILKKQGAADEGLISRALYDGDGAPGRALAFFQNQDVENLKIEVLGDFYAILKGDSFKLFGISEKLSKDKGLSLEILNFLMIWFHGITLFLAGEGDIENPYADWQKQYAKVLTDARCRDIMDTLFTLMDTLSYNVNIKLQWESALLQI